MKKLLLVCLGVSLLVAGVGLAEPEEEIEEHEEGVEILERNVRIDFEMVPLEDDDEGVFIVTASPWYNTSTRYEGDDVEMIFMMAGHVRILDDDKLYISCEGKVKFRGDDEEGEFHVNSSVLLKPGQEIEIASMGDKTLVVRASFVD